MSHDWTHRQNLLLIQGHGLAHYLTITPAIEVLADGAPHANLTLLTTTEAAPAARLHPALTSVLTFDPNAIQFNMTAQRDLVNQLQARGFDGAIIFAPINATSPANTLPAKAGIARVAMLGATPVEGVTVVPPHPRSQHEVSWALDLVAGLGFATEEIDLMLEVPLEASASLFDRLATMRIDDHQPVIVVAPRAQQPYPADQLAKVLHQLFQRHAATLVLDATPAGEVLAAALPSAVRKHVARMPMTLPFDQRVALMEAADVVITDDVAIAQLAAAVKSPVVWLNDDADVAERMAPWHVPYVKLFHPSACPRCDTAANPFGTACPAAITPANVIAATLTLLSAVEAPVDLAAALSDESTLSAAGFVLP